MADIYNVRAIQPAKLAVSEVRLQLLNAMRKEGRLWRRELKKTVQYWKGEKPDFEFVIGLTKTDATLLAGPSGSKHGAQKWVWVNDGTKPHVIRPKKASFLRFRTGYQRGSSPGSMGVRASQTTGPWRSAKAVNHPGYTGAKWTVTLKRSRDLPFRTALNAALREGLRKGGWK